MAGQTVKGGFRVAEVKVNAKATTASRAIPLGPMAWLVYAVRASRVVVFTAMILVLALGVCIRNVHASAEQRAVTLGRELAQFADVLSGAHRVVINGETVYVSTAVSDQGIKPLLDRFETYCDAHNGGVPKDFARRAPEKEKELRQSLGDAWFDHWGVIREEHETEGTVMCIAQYDSGGVGGMMIKVREFMRTWDLHAIGNFRYVYARRVEGNRTQVFTSLTDGPFNLGRVMGRHGEEAPGDDPPDVPRPPRSRRLLSSTVDGAPFGLQVFTTPAAVDQVQSFYERELPPLGWERLVVNHEIGAQGWQRQGVTMVIGAGRANGDDETKVTFTEGRTVDPSVVADGVPDRR
jgi:hypothetical protein